MSAVLTLSGVTTFYGAVQALRGVDLVVNEGEIVTLIGANGAGKSTLMMTICGSPRARDGKILHLGEDISVMPTHEIMRRGIAQSPEGRRIFSRMTVYENLLMGAHGKPEARLGNELDQVFTLFPRLKERLSQRGGTLSGGEQQMLAIGRALMTQPRLLMLDEPSQGIMPKLVDDILAAVVRIRDLGVTVLLVEQRLVEALEIADRAYVLQTGRVVMQGTAKEIAANDDVRRAYLGM